MSVTLPNFITDQRERWGIYKTQAQTAASPGILSDNRMATTANEVLVYWVREAVKANMGVKRKSNKGWFLRYPELTVQADGTLFFPRDVEKFVGILEKGATPTTAELAAGYLAAARLGTPAGCGSYTLQGNSVRFDTSEAGTTRHVVYNSNLNGIWTASAVSSATATTLVPNQTPTYTSAPLVLDNDFYNGLELEVTRTAGSPTVQRRKILDWDGTTFTMYGSAWPFWTPTSADSWGIVCPLDYDELLSYFFAYKTRMSAQKNDPGFMGILSELKSQFYVSVLQRGEYGP